MVQLSQNGLSQVSAVKATNEELLNTNKGLEAMLSEFDQFRKATLESFKR